MLTGTKSHGKRYNRAKTSITHSHMALSSEFASKNITAVILAGGTSSRMGRDKALLEWRGRPFVVHIVEALCPHVEQIAINTNTPAAFRELGLPLVADASQEHRGPLAGIQAALNFSTTPWTLIVPCDNPLLSTQLIDRLCAAIDNDRSDIAYACCNADHHYLYALLRTSLRDQLSAFMRAGDYAVRRWYATLRTSQVDFSDQANCFRNINSAADLATLPSI